jgi:hypothetical protein
VVISDISRWGRDRPKIVIGLWKHLVAPGHRLGAAITPIREGLTAELALAVEPSMILVVDQVPWLNAWVAIMTTDQIAAELTGLASWQLRRTSADELPAPWEDPLVQRATELDLGVRLPSELALRLDIEDDEALPRPQIQQWFDQFGRRLGTAGHP